MKKLNNKGLVAVESMLIVIIVLLVGFIGYYVWHTQKQTNNTLTQANKSTQTSASKVAPFKFKELGVQFVAPQQLKGLSYKVQEITEADGTKDTALYLNDSGLTDLMNQCEKSIGQPEVSEAPNFAAIGRVAGKYDPQQTQDANGPPAPPSIKQFKTFYINYSVPNGAICGSDDQALNNQWQQALAKSQKAFYDSFKATATEIK